MSAQSEFEKMQAQSREMAKLRESLGVQDGIAKMMPELREAAKLRASLGVHAEFEKMQAQSREMAKLRASLGVQDGIAKMMPELRGITKLRERNPAIRAYMDAVGSNALYKTPPIVDASSRRISRLEAEISELKNELEDKKTALAEHNENRERLEQEVRTVELKRVELEKKEDLLFLLRSIDPDVHEKVSANKALIEKFSSGSETDDAFVVSIDIRRSTELMLKARSLKKHLRSLSNNLCNLLIRVCWRHFGVVDKFTGDGILVFFPKFYSGEDAGFHALSACHEAQTIFDACYRANRKSFTSILKDVGLGIGVDYGAVHLLETAGGLTIVGKPVVYACRLGGAPANSVLINQPALEEVSNQFNDAFSFIEDELQVKHEGTILCYRSILTGRHHDPVSPSWAQVEEIKKSHESRKPSSRRVRQKSHTGTRKITKEAISGGQSEKGSSGNA